MSSLRSQLCPSPRSPAARRLTRRAKRRLAWASGIAAAAVIAVVAWAALSPGSYGGSRAGCVTVTVPSSTGGGLLHACGSDAKAMCRRAFARTDKISLLARPQCHLAGLTPPASSP
jgi:hypothetical protein